MPMLAAARAVQGLGSGLFDVALYVVVGRVVPPALHPRIIAAFAAAWALPSVAGPPVAGLIVEAWGWRWVFLLAAALAVPAAGGSGPCAASAHRSGISSAALSGSRTQL